MEYDDATRKEFMKTRILAIVLLVGAPILCFVIAEFLQAQGSVENRSGGEVDIMYYALAVIGLVSPALVPIILRAQISNIHRGAKPKASPAQLMTTLFMIKFSMVEATFIYGLVVFLLSGDLQRMLLFYPIGAVWAVIHWPREEAMKQMIERVEKP